MRWLRALYLSNGLAVGTLYGFVPVLLQAKGFNPALIGVTTFLGGILYATAGPLGVFGGGGACAVIGGVIGLAALPSFGQAPGEPGVEVPAAPAVSPAT